MRRAGAVADDHVIGENPQMMIVLPSSEPLESADTDVRPGDACKHSSGHQSLSQDFLTGGHCGERAGRRHT